MQSTVRSNCFTVNGADDMQVRSVDFSPNRHYYLATAGDDCSARIWDLRKADAPIVKVSGHSHW